MGDPVFDFLNSGGQAAPSAPAATPSGKPSNDPVYEFLNSGGKSVPAPQEKPQEPAKQPNYVGSDPADEVAKNLISGTAATIAGGWHGLAKLAAGGSMDEAADAVHADQEKFTRVPETAAGAKGVEALQSPYSPLTWIPRLGKAAGEFSQEMGAGPGVSTAVETGINALAPVALAKGLRVVGGGKTVPGKAEAAETRIEPTLSAQQSIEQPIVKAGPIGQPIVGKPLELEPATQSRDRFQTADNKLPAETGVQPEPAHFLDAPPEAGPKGSVEASSRAKTLQRVGINQARLSALEGDAKAGATDYQTSKLDNAAGNHMRAVLDSEKSALQNYSEGLIRDTGGTMGADTSTLYSRGNTILAPLDELNNYFNKQVSELYKEADSRAQGQPVNLPKTQEFVGGDKAEFLGTTEGEALLKGVTARMKSLGMVDAEGNPQPVTVKQAEQLKQYLNNQWQPRTSRLVSGMKNAIDDDVLQTAGEDVYRKARAMRSMKANVFENDLTDPQGRTIQNGVAKLFDANGKGLELKSGASTEKVADIVTTLPADQLGQIVKTLKNLPPELKAQGEAALAEIKAQFANKIHDTGSAQQGQWAAKNVSKYLNKNAARLQQVFTAEELDKFNDLNDAGHILAKDQSYPGAAVQEHNLVQRGAMAGVRAGSAATGGALFGGPGAAAGGFVGDLAAKALGERSSLKSSQKRVVKLSDFPGIND